ncbi:hypothetical protein ACUODJ_57480, partial [Escherichia sp. HC-CC]
DALVVSVGGAEPSGNPAGRQWFSVQVVELGPVNATIHKINECVNAADLQLLARMYQRIMEQLVA